MDDAEDRESTVHEPVAAGDPHTTIPVNDDDTARGVTVTPSETFREEQVVPPLPTIQDWSQDPTVAHVRTGQQVSGGACDAGRIEAKVASYRVAQAADAGPGLPQVPSYEIIEELGRGGMGVVYKARQVRLNRICALKMILAGAHAGREATARFLAEAETVARLEHPAIVQVHHLGDHDGRPYLELEYVDGGSLADHRDGAPLPADEAAELVEALARAIQYSHGLGVVHRDLKPSNVLLTRDGRPKIADFGLAKMLDANSQITGSNLVLGTPSFMAPEQASGDAKGAGPSADVYALGAILYALLTGRPPFRAATIAETLRQVQEESPVPPCRLQPSLPRDVETIALKCLQKRPADRYATAEALEEDLRRFRAREPILARPIPAWERGLKLARRRPVAAGMSAALIACMLGLLGLGAYSYRRISRSLQAETLANANAQKALATAEAETYRALVNDVAALRLGRRSGWRDEALRDLQRTASMNVPRRNVVALRTDAVQCLGEVDVREVARFVGHGGGVRSLDFSPDSRTLAAADYDGHLRLWDVPQPRHLRVVDDPGVNHPLQYTEEAPMPAVRFRPGGGVAFATWGRRVAWLDTPASSAIGTKAADDAQPCGLAFDARGQSMAVGWSNGRITVQDPESAATRRVIATAATGPFNPVALSPDGRWVAGLGTDREVRLYRAGGSDESALLGKHAGAIRSFAFSPDGRTLASASSDNTVKLWDLERREEYATLRGHTARVNAVAFHPGGDIVASACDDETVRLWDARTGLVILVLRPGIGSVLSVAFSPDGSRVAYAHNTVGVGEISGLRERRSLAGHTYEVLDVAFHRDEPWLVSGSANHEVHLWDARSGRLLSRWLCDLGRQRTFECLALSPVGRLLAVGSGSYDGVLAPDFSIRLWSLDDGPPGLSLTGHEAPVSALAFDPAGARLASGDRDGVVIVWDARSRQELWRVQADRSPVRSVFFLDAGTRLLVAWRGGLVAMYDLKSAAPIRSRQLEGGVSQLAVAPDEGFAVVGGAGGNLRTLDLRNLDTAGELANAHVGEVRGVALSRDGLLLATGGDDRRVVLRDSRTLRERFSFPPVDGPVYRLAFSPDARRLAIAGVEQRVTLWDLGALRAPLAAIGLSWRPDEPPPPGVAPAGPPIEVPAPKTAVGEAWDLMGDGERLRNEGRPQDALAPYERALRIWEGIVRDRPTVPFFRAELAATLAAIASIHQQGGRAEQARDAWRRTLDLGVPPRDGDARVAFNMARVYALGSAVDRDRAAAWADRALAALREALASGYKDRRQIRENPDLDPLRSRPDFKELLTNLTARKGWPFLLDRGRTLAARGDVGAAIAELEEAARDLQALAAVTPSDPYLRRQRDHCQIELAAARRRKDGPHAPAAADAAACELESLDSRDPLDWLAAARGHALGHELAALRGSATTAEDQAERAVGALRRAIALGFRDPHFLASEPTLRLLGDRPDFGALIADLHFPTDPFGP
jgi:WD40 repeat protein/tRNA A-37 threonylcarbamoyl transferase component Bud32/tetratricopeptide (TPR) repeat protein